MLRLPASKHSSYIMTSKIFENTDGDENFRDKYTEHFSRYSHKIHKLLIF